MPSESDLRDLLQGPDPEGRAAIDLDAVLTRARRRRRPKVVAAQALGSVAVIGALFTAVVAVQPPQQASDLLIAEDTAGGGDADAAPFVDDSALRKSDVCGDPVTDQPSSGPLSAAIEVVTTFEPGTLVPVTVTLRNDGPDRIVGTTGSAPFLTFSRDGIVLWHTYAVQDLSVRVLDLAPGESVTYDAVFERGVCASEEDLEMADPDRPLPLAGPGDYELRAVLVVSTDDGSGLVASTPPLPIEIVG